MKIFHVFRFAKLSNFFKKNILNPLKMFAVKKSLEPLVRRKFEKKMSKFLPGIVYIRVALSEH